MASMWRRAMVYLGLVDDDEYDDYDPYPPEPAVQKPVRRVAAAPPPAAERAYEPEQMSGVRTLPPREPPSDSGVSIPRGAVVRPKKPTQQRVHIVAPEGFNDAQEIGDRLKANQPVIVNLQSVDRDLSRRLIDFSSGLSYGLGGSMEKVADAVFLLTPTDVEVSADEKRRLQERGLYRS